MNRFPDYQDLSDMLLSLNEITDPLDESAQSYISAAITAWLRATGYPAWIVENESTRHYDIEFYSWQSFMSLDSVICQVTRIELDGEAVDMDRFSFYPLNKRQKTHLCAAGLAGGRLSITGYWGYAVYDPDDETLVPDDVWYAVLHWAGAHYIIDRREGSVSAIRQGDVSVQYASESEQRVRRWLRVFNDFAAGYRVRL